MAANVVTKANLIAYLKNQEPSLGNNFSAQITNAYFEKITSSLEKGENVTLPGFGTFSIRKKKARPGRNPKTGVRVIISARNVVLFHISQKLKIKLKNIKK